jgi:peptide alpha-N-acetyltransferase
VEYSELLLYHVRILDDMGNFQLALDMLELNDNAILNCTVGTEMKGVTM